jgi:2-amino-4-hydroxy-6-hydroxymethyldihydropteridine diphosphokinase
MGLREENVLAAFLRLSRVPGLRLEEISSLYETSPVGVVASREFVNAACVARTKLPAVELLHLFKDIERVFGRDAGAESADRPLDIDIVVYGSAVVDSELLTLPHPRFHERLFVLVPLVEIRPHLAVPPSGHSVEDLLRRCAGSGRVRRISGRSDTLNFLKTKRLE